MTQPDDPRRENRPPTDRDRDGDTGGDAYTATVNRDSEGNPLGAMLFVSPDALDALDLADAEHVRLTVTDDGAAVVHPRDDDAAHGAEP